MRRATLADTNAIETHVHQAFSVYVSRLHGRRPEPMVDDYVARIQHDLVYVLEVDGAVACVLILIAHEDHVFIDTVAVAPAMQRRGVGRELMAYAEAEARRRGLVELRLYTNVAMHENLAWYAALGYCETHRAEQTEYQRVFFRKVLRDR